MLLLGQVHVTEFIKCGAVCQLLPFQGWVKSLSQERLVAVGNFSGKVNTYGWKLTDPEGEHLKALQNLWSTFEIAGVALVDMAVWHWMYDHPDADPAALREAVIQIARDTWNEYYAPVFGEKDVLVLGVYSHMIYRSMYIPDYPLGHIIAFQIESYLADRDPGPEIERICTLGAITPERWMREALGESISVRPMIEAAEKALRVIK